MEMTRINGEEMVSVARSMTKGVLDPALEREGARIVARIAAPLAPLLPASEVQEIISTMAKTQVTKKDLRFQGESQECSEAVRRVSFITLQPVISGANNYIVHKKKQGSSKPCNFITLNYI